MFCVIQKFIHALSPTPAAMMSASELATPVPLTTPSPYDPQPSGPNRGGGAGLLGAGKPAWAAAVEAEGGAGGIGGEAPWRYAAPPP